MPNQNRLFLAVFLAAASLAIGGCGGGSNGGNLQSLSALPGSGTLTAPTASGPQNWTVLVGGEVRDNAFQAFDYFDEDITIDEGDSVTWVGNGETEPHTVTFLGPRSSPPPRTDPTNALPFGGSTYDGSVYTSSGFFTGTHTYTLTFPKAGTYAYLCLLHEPVMAGIVVVQPAGTPYPHPQGFYTGQGMQALNASLSAAQGAVREFPFTDGGTTLAAGIASGLAAAPPSNSTVMRFLDSSVYNGNSTVTVPLGTTLTWVNEANNALHTVTFPPLGQQPPHNPLTPATGGPTYDGSTLVHSGLIPPGHSFSVTFTRRGTYPYYCILHIPDGMTGTVIVQ
jgi:plastocyanin